MELACGYGEWALPGVSDWQGVPGDAGGHFDQGSASDGFADCASGVRNRQPGFSEFNVGDTFYMRTDYKLQMGAC